MKIREIFFDFFAFRENYVFSNMSRLEFTYQGERERGGGGKGKNGAAVEFLLRETSSKFLIDDKSFLSSRF